MYGTTVQYLDGGAVGSKIGYVGKELTISVPYLFTCGRPVLIDWLIDFDWFWLILIGYSISWFLDEWIEWMKWIVSLVKIITSSKFQPKYLNETSSEDVSIPG